MGNKKKKNSMLPELFFLIILFAVRADDIKQGRLTTAASRQEPVQHKLVPNAVRLVLLNKTEVAKK